MPLEQIADLRPHVKAIQKHW